MGVKDIGENLEGAGWVGVAVGAVLLAPVLVKGLRPVAKSAIKGYLMLSDRTRELVAETGEHWQDLVAEAKAEHASQGAGAEMMTMELPPEEAGAMTTMEEPEERAVEEAPPQRRTGYRPEGPTPAPEPA